MARATIARDAARLAPISPIRPVAASAADGGLADPFLSPQQVAAMLPGVTVETLKGLRKRGKGPRFSKPSGERGHATLYRRSDVIAWVEGSVSSTRDQS